jgi:hypothetical protein
MKNKKSAQSESLFNTGAGLEEVHKVITSSTEIDKRHLSSTNATTEPIEVNNITYTVEHLSSTKVVTQSIDVNNTTYVDEHQSSTKVINESERWNSRYFGQEPPQDVDNNGQLSIFDHSYKAPDPDDYKSIEEYETTWSKCEQDQLSHQELLDSTNVLNISKNLDQKSNLLLVTPFVEDELQNNASDESVQYNAYILSGNDSSSVENELQSGALFVEDELKNDASAPFIQVQADTERFLNETHKAGRHRKGCLYKFLDKKTLKDGTVASYPRITVPRDADNVKHWRWALNWEEKIDGEWKNRSTNIPAGAVCMVIAMQNTYRPLEEIIAFVKRSKIKPDKKDKDNDKTKSKKQGKAKSKSDKKGKGKSKKLDS